MDDDPRQLIRLLCTLAGMIMEDASVVAATTRQEQAIGELRRAPDQIDALLRAVEALAR